MLEALKQRSPAVHHASPVLIRVDDIGGVQDFDPLQGVGEGSRDLIPLRQDLLEAADQPVRAHPLRHPLKALLLDSPAEQDALPLGLVRQSKGNVVVLPFINRWHRGLHG